ncbi:MAG: Maf family protein [Planctomycetota bacterium]
MKEKAFIILASSSPRRSQLLAEAGYEFSVSRPDIDESAYSSEGIEPAEYAVTLALAKAKNVAGRFADKLIIGADTIVDFDGLVIGKPADADDAKRITQMLFSRRHKVITGLAIVIQTQGIEITESDTTIVYPKSLSAKQIAEHIESETWQGKAGAYAIQENDEFIERIEGSFTNVMGMPMELLEKLLKEINQKRKLGRNWG